MGKKEKEIETYRDLAEECIEYFNVINIYLSNGNIEDANTVINNFNNNLVEKYGKENIKKVKVLIGKIKNNIRALKKEICINSYPDLYNIFLYIKYLNEIKAELAKEIE